MGREHKDSYYMIRNSRIGSNVISGEEGRVVPNQNFLISFGLWQVPLFWL